jgi:hypothetical protein
LDKDNKILVVGSGARADEIRKLIPEGTELIFAPPPNPIEFLMYSMFPHAIDSIIDKHLPKDKPVKKCRLPNCNNLTDHNKGYCSANHYKLHHKQLKERI